MTVKKQIWEEHEVLYHYTSENALRGILKSQTLWATHYKFLNDPTEIAQIKNILAGTVKPHVEEAIRSIQKKSFAAKRRIQRSGGLNAVVAEYPKIIINVLYRVTFEGGERGVPFAEPYIVSFCSHDDDRTYTQENGLLSQWRAYGRDSGCAIIFDCKKLVKLMVDGEAQHYNYSFGTFGDVVYEGDEKKTQEEFSNFLKILPIVCKILLTQRESEFLESFATPEFEKFYTEFLICTSRFKHQAFEEEREVRIVSSPITKEYIEFHKQHGVTDFGGKPLKKIHHRQDAENKMLWIPYIKLLESVEDELLPIRKIIIGPGQNQTIVQRRTQELVHEIYGKSKIKIENSKTPFRKHL